ncbi:MAG: hypothetical protein A2X18_01215 [Bacteroidetes bacterium GWF2_40_14]|nr:MAG: hypothetical protein A2X18_01215 [Bacteroidetes bacterium GWF2_40_14]
MVRGNIKILAIDDNDDNLLSLSALICEMFPEATVLTANSGEKGLLLAEKEDPHVILLDILMPGMDGYEVCKRLKSDKKLSRIPVVFITALRSDKESRIKALECGAEAFITKPMDEYELTAQIQAMLKIKEANNRNDIENELLTALVEARTSELNETHKATLNLLEDLSNENIARRRSEEAHRTSERQMRTLFQTIPDMIWLKDKEGVYLACNTMFERFFNHPESEISGKTDYDFVSQEFADFFREMDRIAMEAGKPSVNEEWITFGDDGHLALLETIKTPVYGSQGELIGVLGIGRDITQRYQSEQELIKAKDKAEESNRLKTAFLANISHEIRTPLNSILGFAEMLKEPGLSREDRQEFIGFIEMGGKRMLSIINDLIDISKIEAGLTEVNISSYSLNEQIDDLYGFFKPAAEQKNLEFLVHKGLSDYDTVINSDKSKVDAILINLIKNALKFTSVGTIELGYEKKGALIEFYIKDTGIGIKPEKQELIFERFRQGSESVTRSFEGSGLGLSISKAYAEMLGGRLWVESEPDKGSTFYFTIPHIS